ncbi:MAG: ABC transporter permease [Roseomonas sp.]|nr:ABC transporter permease [Roseomonas sp.]
MRRLLPRLLLGLPAVALLTLFFVLPYVEMVAMSFRAPAFGQPFGSGHTLMHYGRALGDPIYTGALIRSLLTGALITALCLVVSFPLALHLSRLQGRWHVVFYACIVSPLLIGVLVRNFGWMVLVAVDGPFNRWLLAAGLIERPIRVLFTQGLVVMALVHVFTPFMVLPIATALRNVRPELRDASASLGAGGWETFRRVTLPLSFPGVQAGVTLVFVLSVAAYVTPALLGGQGIAYMPAVVVRELIGSFAWPFGAALAVIMAASTLAVVTVFTLATHRLAERTRA